MGGVLVWIGLWDGLDTHLVPAVMPECDPAGAAFGEFRCMWFKVV